MVNVKAATLTFSSLAPEHDADHSEGSTRMCRLGPSGGRSSGIACQCAPSPPSVLGRRYHRLHNSPFGISQIARVPNATAISAAAVFRYPHRALSKNQAPFKESHTIHALKALPDRSA